LKKPLRLPPEEAAKRLPPHPMLLLNAKSDSHEELMKMQPKGDELAILKARLRAMVVSE
jgi:hypothetical protein